MKMKHPDAKGTVDVRKDQIEMYESQGWVEAKAPAKSDDEKPASK